MSDLFVCENCNVIEVRDLAPAACNGQRLCSLCHPLSKRWHGQFPRELYDNKSDVIVCNKPSGLSFTA